MAIRKVTRKTTDGVCVIHEETSADLVKILNANPDSTVKAFIDRITGEDNVFDSVVHSIQDNISVISNMQQQIMQKMAEG